MTIGSQPSHKLIVGGIEHELNLVAPAVVDVSGSDSVMRTFRIWTGTITTATALSMVANLFR